MSAVVNWLVHCCSIFLWDLDWKYSARWEPSIWRCRLLSALQRAQMTDLDQIFCMWYLLCVWRAASKNFVHFLLLLPPQKGRSIRSGCFFQNYRSTVILAWFFPLYKSRNLSPCQKCRTYGNFGRPLQIIQTRDLSHARLLSALAAILAAWSNSNPMCGVCNVCCSR